MPNKKLLSIYLNDHLAASVAGRQLAQRTVANNRGSDYGNWVRGFVGEVEEDQEALLDVMRRLQVSVDPIKPRAAWVVEKLGRLKLNGQIRGYSPLSRLVEIEGLCLGIDGKLSMWRSLEQLAEFDTRLAVTDFDTLIKRAERQREEIEVHRLKAANSAFTEHQG
jgi:hypothetical protein